MNTYLWAFKNGYTEIEIQKEDKKNEVFDHAIKILREEMNLTIIIKEKKKK